MTDQDNSYNRKDKNFEITVETSFDFENSKPSKKEYIFIYKLSIRNLRADKVQVMFRHWNIWNAAGEETYIAGHGIDDTSPVIVGGETYHYQSTCPLETMAGSMKGKFEMVDERGKALKAETPLFRFFVPEQYL